MGLLAKPILAREALFAYLALIKWLTDIYVPFVDVTEAYGVGPQLPRLRRGVPDSANELGGGDLELSASDALQTMKLSGTGPQTGPKDKRLPTSGSTGFRSAWLFAPPSTSGREAGG
jgi:hypothetical protein